MIDPDPPGSPEYEENWGSGARSRARRATTVEADVLVKTLLEIAVTSLEEVHSTG
jgi:hypothetical protein